MKIQQVTGVDTIEEFDWTADQIDKLVEHAWDPGSSQNWDDGDDGSYPHSQHLEGFWRDIMMYHGVQLEVEDFLNSVKRVYPAWANMDINEWIGEFDWDDEGCLEDYEFSEDDE